jgi:enoyl-CoA hydratase/carnithine racemase
MTTTNIEESPMSEKCYYEVNERGVALLKVNNPPMNALDEPTMRQLESSMKKIAADDAVKVVVITGEGATFIVGADINKVKDVTTAEEGVALTSEAQGIINLIEDLRKPVIAAINGLCLGGGTELAMACHIRILGDQAQMGLPEILLGIMPAFGGTQRAARILGPAMALEVMLTGKFLPAAECGRIGLVNRVVPHATVMDEAMKLAKELSFKGPLAVAAIIEAVMDGGRMSLAEGLKLESELFGRLAGSEDKKEGIAAFFEKRKPVFKGK